MSGFCGWFDNSVGLFRWERYNNGIEIVNIGLFNDYIYGDVIYYYMYVDVSNGVINLRVIFRGFIF